MDDHLETMTSACHHVNPVWKYDPWPDCVQMELPDSIEEVLHIDLDIEEAFCKDLNNQPALMDAIRVQLCGDQVNCSIITELPTCEEILGGGDVAGGKVLDEVIYHTVRRRDLASVNISTTPRPKKIRPKGKLAIKVNIYTRLSKKLGLWSTNVTRQENLKVAFDIPNNQITLKNFIWSFRESRMS